MRLFQGWKECFLQYAERELIREIAVDGQLSSEHRQIIECALEFFDQEERWPSIAVIQSTTGLNAAFIRKVLRGREVEDVFTTLELVPDNCAMELGI